MKKGNSERNLQYNEEANRETMKQIKDVYSLGVVEDMDEMKRKDERNQSKE